MHQKFCKKKKICASTSGNFHLHFLKSSDPKIFFFSKYVFTPIEDPQNMSPIFFQEKDLKNDLENHSRKIFKTVLEIWFSALSNGYHFITVFGCRIAMKPPFCWFCRNFLTMHISHDFRTRKNFKTVLESWFWVLSKGYHFITINCRFLW